MRLRNRSQSDFYHSGPHTQTQAVSHAHILLEVTEVYVIHCGLQRALGIALATCQCWFIETGNAQLEVTIAWVQNRNYISRYVPLRGGCRKHRERAIFTWFPVYMSVVHAWTCGFDCLVMSPCVHLRTYAGTTQGWRFFCIQLRTNGVLLKGAFFW